MENYKRGLDITKMAFENSFAEKQYYNMQTNDAEHLSCILNLLNLKNGDTLLDLGTGIGYLAFPIAQTYPDCKVVGLDIVSNTLKENNNKARIQKLTNLSFMDYDGIYLPYPDCIFDVIVTRYALHHFPNIEIIFSEMARTLKQGGLLFISDPTPNENDSNRFVDAYMQMKKDGHNKFYTFEEFTTIAEKLGLLLQHFFETKIRFPRKETMEYHALLNSTNQSVRNGYEVTILGDEIYITEKVLNMCFIKL